MMMLPCAFWPLAEHALFGQNCFDASIGSVSVCICYSMPMDACFFNHSFPFHRIVGFYQAMSCVSIYSCMSFVFRKGQPILLQSFVIPRNLPILYLLISQQS